ncbi:MAG: hypothetical protein JSU01_14400 [Bacteroidetes bacterium]|nr:hypothetical protein [Bacteroidota bacterium]
MSTNIADSEENNITAKPFIYYKKLSSFDKWSIGIYLVITIVVAYFYYHNDAGYAQFMIFIYAFILQLCLYLFMYGHLRNFRCYLIWFGFSIIHLAMYFVMKGDERLQMARGNPAVLLRNTFVLLLVFQLLRFISLKTQRMELVAPNKSSEDDFDHRKITIIDKALFLAYMAVWGTLTYFSFQH